jgi:hypothetical protein
MLALYPHTHSRRIAIQRIPETLILSVTEQARPTINPHRHVPMPIGGARLGSTSGGKRRRIADIQRGDAAGQQPVTPTGATTKAASAMRSRWKVRSTVSRNATMSR